MSVKGFCINDLFLKFVVLSDIIDYCFCGLGVWVWFIWVVFVESFLRGCNRYVSLGYSYFDCLIREGFVFKFVYRVFVKI